MLSQVKLTAGFFDEAFDFEEAEEGVGGVDGLVDEAGVAAAGHVGEERVGSRGRLGGGGGGGWWWWWW